MLKLYTTLLSANGRKPLAVARHLDINISIEQVNVYTGEGNKPEYRSINPWGKIPTLTDGDFVLWESNAIMIYLAEHYGGNRLYSSDSRDRANIVKWLFWESSHWQPVLTRVLAPRVSQVLFKNNANTIQVNWQDEELISLLKNLERAFDAKPFLNGNFVTLADYSVAGMTTYFRACNFPNHIYPAIHAWISRLDTLLPWTSTKDSLWES